MHVSAVLSEMCVWGGGDGGLDEEAASDDDVWGEGGEGFRGIGGFLHWDWCERGVKSGV